LGAPLALLEDVVNLGIHPSVADAYFDEFIANIILANVENTLIGFSVSHLSRFFLVMAVLWQAARGNAVKLPESVELDIDLKENGKKLEDIFARIKLAELAQAINGKYSEGLKSARVDLNILGLPVVMDGEAGKITVKVSEYHPTNKIIVL
jgi:hypothetical protein